MSPRSKPFKTVGIVGGGQLAQMIALAAVPLGIRCICLDPSDDAPAGRVAQLVRADFSDVAALSALADASDVITYEFENISAQALAASSLKKLVCPSLDALRITQDRFAEKACFSKHGIPTARFVEIQKQTRAEDASYAERFASRVEKIGFPALIKTRFEGYDGKGQRLIRTASELVEACAFARDRDVIVEEVVPFKRELSLVSVRGMDGQCRFYPLVENHHADGILRATLAPAPLLTANLTNSAREAARNIMTALDYVGVFTLELFESDGQLLANEMAPRVHNSGHWTIEGAGTSQFENHIRAVCGLPLGTTDAIDYSLMCNILGSEPNIRSVLEFPNAHLHMYGKEPRHGRKLGHVTFCYATEEARAADLESAKGVCPGASQS